MRWQQKGGAVLTAVVVIIVLLFVAAYIAPQIFFAYSMNKMIKENPGLQLTPKPMTPASAARVKPESLNSYGFEFQTPWGKPRIDPGYEYFTVFSFPDGVQMYFYNPSKAANSLFLAPLRQPGAPLDASQRIFGRRDINSNYDAMRAVLETRPPAQVSYFGNREQTMMAFMVLSFKSTEVRETTSEILAFELGEWRGFQVNEPKANSKSTVYLFDKKEGCYQFSFSRSGEAQNTLIPQAEINAVLLSLRPAVPAEVKQEKPPKKSPKASP